MQHGLCMATNNADSLSSPCRRALPARSKYFNVTDAPPPESVTKAVEPSIGRSNAGMADEASLRKLVQEYQGNRPPRHRPTAADLPSVELNPAYVKEVFEVPSALTLARHVGRNQPLIVRRYAQSVSLPALESWSRRYLQEKVGDREVSIAVTPHGCVMSSMPRIWTGVDPFAVVMQMP